MGLLLLGIAGGFVGRFFETEHLSFPAANNLSQAAAIMATQENIVGTPPPAPVPEFTLGFSVSKPVVADVSFTQTADCGADMSIKAYQSYTVGFLCLDAKDAKAANLDSTIKEAAKKVNELVVAFKTNDSKLAHRALADGAVSAVIFEKKTTWVYTKNTSAHGTSVTIKNPPTM